MHVDQVINLSSQSPVLLGTRSLGELGVETEAMMHLYMILPDAENEPQDWIIVGPRAGEADVSGNQLWGQVIARV